MRPLYSLLCALPLLLGTVAGQSAAPSADTSGTMTAMPAQSGPRMDEKSQAILKSMTDFFAKADAVHLKLELTTKVNGAAAETGKNVVIASAARPNKFFRTIEQDGKLMELRVSDGTSRYFYFAEANAYEAKKALPNFEAMLANDNMSDAALFGPLLRDNNYDRVVESFTSFKYDREIEQDGHKIAVIKFERREGEGELMIRTGETPVPEKLVINPHEVAMTFEFAFSDWKFGKDVDPKAFEFKAPEGARKVRSVSGTLAKLQGGAPLLGEQAPDFLLPGVDGKDVKLVDYKGKILILDFWATWCGPCRKGLPTLAKVVAAYKDKGVVLHAVNLRESKEVVASFAKQFSNPINPLLDEEGKVGEKYQVGGIPHTVIIDKTGKIQVVHVGLSEDYESELHEELDAILAGQDISKE